MKYNFTLLLLHEKELQKISTVICTRILYAEKIPTIQQKYLLNMFVFIMSKNILHNFICFYRKKTLLSM